MKIVLEGEVTETGIKWRTNPYDGRVVYRKTPKAQADVADGRISEASARRDYARNGG